MKEFLYRYEEVNYESGIRICLRRYEILRKTPKGAWIIHFQGTKQEKFILLTAMKQFACETVDKALISFKFRKLKQLKIWN